MSLQQSRSTRTESQDRASEKVTRPRSVRSRRNEKLTTFIKPMLASIHEEPFDDPEWIFEIKWDGYRAIAEVNQKGVRLYSRNGLSFLNLYPSVAEELKKIKEDVVLDGEIVVLNKDSKPDFQKLQQYDNHPSLPIIFYVFDCLFYKGKPITTLPLVERKKVAQKALVKSKIIRYADHVEAQGLTFFSKVVDMDLEGIIAKRASSPYHPGKRSRDWLKIKNHNTQEAVIAGFTAPRGSREFFGALILGIYENNKLKYIGHTGTGFTSAILKNVYETLKPLVRSSSPFGKKISVNSPVTWVEPRIVCAIKFTEMTDEGILRHPVFLGLRIDKSAREADTMDVAAKKPSGSSKKKTTRTSKKKTPPKKQLKKNSAEKKILANGHTVTITNPDKVYWPGEGITKGALVDYYNSISKYLLPYLKGRPQSLRRNPSGIKNKGFFHKDAGNNVPEWVDTIRIRSDSANRDINYILCNNKATLLYLNNLGCIELNPWNSTVAKPDHPDYMVIDLDPSDKNTFDQVIESARAVKDVLDQAGAPAFCKTSGATGLHIYVPLKAQYTYDDIRDFAGIIARLTEERLPGTTTTERPLNKRKGRIYLDYLQNKKGQTLASVYSVRPKPGATVSAPLLWNEVKPGLLPSQFTIHNMVQRLEKTGDLFRGVLKEKINLKECLKNLGA